MRTAANPKSAFFRLALKPSDPRRRRSMGDTGDGRRRKAVVRNLAFQSIGRRSAGFATAGSERYGKRKA